MQKRHTKKKHMNQSEQKPFTDKAEKTAESVSGTEEKTENEKTAEAAEAVAGETTAEPQESSQPDPLQEKLDAALAKQEEYLNMAQRVQADFDNYRRRNQNLRQESFDDGAREFAKTLLPVIDNLERAITAAAESPDESLKSGVEMVCRQLTDAFTKRGITSIDCLGKPFDPNLENAVMQGTAEEGEPGTVCAVLQKGYQMEGRLVRAAMVKVVAE